MYLSKWPVSEFVRQFFFLKSLNSKLRSLFFCSELEQYVGSLQNDSATTHRAVTLKDVEEGAVTLRKVGESLAGLKGMVTAFPSH